jgi:hypothetical protein
MEALAGVGLVLRRRWRCYGTVSCRRCRCTLCRGRGRIRSPRDWGGWWWRTEGARRSGWGDGPTLDARARRAGRRRGKRCGRGERSSWSCKRTTRRRTLVVVGHSGNRDALRLDCFVSVIGELVPGDTDRCIFCHSGRQLLCKTKREHHERPVAKQESLRPVFRAYEESRDAAGFSDRLRRCRSLRDVGGRLCRCREQRGNWQDRKNR